MAQPLCMEYPSALVHVILRGNGRQELFRDDEGGRLSFGRLGLYFAKAGITVYRSCSVFNTPISSWGSGHARSLRLIQPGRD
jgi:hypothetical protein